MTKNHATAMSEVSLMHTEYGADLYDVALSARMHTAMLAGRTSYPFFRKLTFAVSTDLERFFDNLAMITGWNVHRLKVGRMLMDADGLFIQAEGFRKSGYCSCNFRIWADSLEHADRAKEQILAKVGDAKIDKAIVSICWAFLDASGDLNKSYIEEIVEDAVHDEAYPELDEGVARFIDNFLESDEAILVLQGKPGTGKTRLIRAILGAMTKRKGEKVGVLYTSDRKTMEDDRVYVHFVTDDQDVFVIEDADYILKPRSDGNENLHRFLTIADGVVRSQGRKIIFSTNLPNIGDLDEALIRPGRCFARLVVRELSKVEAAQLLTRLCSGDAKMASEMLGHMPEQDRKGYTVADVYRAYNQAAGAKPPKAGSATDRVSRPESITA